MRTIVYREQMAEADRRAEELESGAVQGIEGLEALKQVRQALSEHTGRICEPNPALQKYQEATSPRNPLPAAPKPRKPGA